MTSTLGFVPTEDKKSQGTINQRFCFYNDHVFGGTKADNPRAHEMATGLTSVSPFYTPGHLPNKEELAAKAQAAADHREKHEAKLKMLGTGSSSDLPEKPGPEQVILSDWALPDDLKHICPLDRGIPTLDPNQRVPLFATDYKRNFIGSYNVKRRGRRGDGVGVPNQSASSQETPYGTFQELGPAGSVYQVDFSYRRSSNPSAGRVAFTDNHALSLSQCAAVIPEPGSPKSTRPPPPEPAVQMPPPLRHTRFRPGTAKFAALRELPTGGADEGGGRGEGRDAGAPVDGEPPPLSDRDMGISIDDLAPKRRTGGRKKHRKAPDSGRTVDSDGSGFPYAPPARDAPVLRKKRPRGAASPPPQRFSSQAFENILAYDEDAPAEPIRASRRPRPKFNGQRPPRNPTDMRANRQEEGMRVRVGSASPGPRVASHDKRTSTPVRGERAASALGP